MNSKVNDKNGIFEQYSEKDIVKLKECLELVLCEFTENNTLTNCYFLADIQPLARLNKEITETLLNSNEMGPKEKKGGSNE